MRILIAAVVPLALAACAPLESLPDGASLTGAANPDTSLAQAPAGPPLVYAQYQVIEPADWRGVNDKQAGD